ncbi:MAG: sulfite exporter TauE/SafE family protein [Acetobacterales bacterium]
MIEATAALIGGLSWQTLAMIVGVAFVASVFAGTTGFGLGPILILVLAPILGIKAVLPTLAVTAAMNNLTRIAAFWSHIHWRVAGICLCTGIPGVLAGTLIYDALSADAVAVLLGVLLSGVLIGRNLKGRLFQAREMRLGTGGILAVSAFMGVVSGAAANTGVIIISMLLSSGIEGAALLGTKAVIVVGITGARSAMFAGLDVLTAELAFIGFLVGCCTVPGIALSRLLVHRIPVHIHTRALECVIALGAVSFLWRGLRGYGVF